MDHAFSTAPSVSDTAASASHQPTSPTYVWDLPTRLFHWLLVICVLGALGSGFIGNDWLQWHMPLGLAALTLLLFRLLWGLCGGHWSRFAQWWPSPTRLIQQWRGQHVNSSSPGHSASGAASVWIMLLLLGLQIATGLMASDDVFYAGPLVQWVPASVVEQATRLHHWGKWALLAWLVLHIAAVMVYQWRGKRLIHAMLTGWQNTSTTDIHSVDNNRTRLLAAVILAGCIAVAWWLYLQIA